MLSTGTDQDLGIQSPGTDGALKRYREAAKRMNLLYNKSRRYETHLNIPDVYSAEGSTNNPSLLTTFSISKVAKIDAAAIHMDDCAMSLPVCS